MSIEVTLYQLNSIPATKAFPRLIESVHSKGHNIRIVCSNAAMVRACDELLWTYSQLAFLPHGTMHDPYRDKQQIYITDAWLDNPSGAKVTALYGAHELDSAIENMAASWSDDKALVMFDPINKVALLEYIAALKAHQMKYRAFEQGADGAWKILLE